jgi:hypothetical protein
MKKLAIGCAAVVVLAVAIAGVGSYYAYRKVTSTVASFAELAAISDLEQSVRNQSEFVPSASAELTESQVENYLAVQRAIRTRLGFRVDELERTYHRILDKDESDLSDAPLLIAAYRDLAAVFVDAKRTQIDALNDAGMSLAEYRWIRRQIYGALGVPMADFDLAGIFSSVKNGRTPDLPDIMSMTKGPAGPENNQKLVAPHRKELEDLAGLAFFGL